MLTFYSYGSAVAEAQRIADIIHAPVHIVNNPTKARYYLRDAPLERYDPLWTQGWLNITTRYPNLDSGYYTINGFYTQLGDSPTDRL